LIIDYSKYWKISLVSSSKLNYQMKARVQESSVIQSLS